MKKKENKEFKVMPWLRKVREKLSEEHYKNPKKYLEKRKKIVTSKETKTSK
ncbi:MAG: hypothetical protein GY830_03680 [Bacteroidetes bacterium]|nr:hypothetical protein [Bacteroidota bacterium]